MLSGGVTLALKVAFNDLPFAPSPTFTDLNKYGMDQGVSSVTIERGRSAYASGFEVGRMTARLWNRLGWYDPDTTVGPFVGMLEADKRVQVSGSVGGVAYPRFDGFIESWRPIELFGQVPGVELTAYDPLWLMARTRMDGVGYRRKALTFAPTAYWRFGDRDGPSLAYDETGNGNDAYYVTDFRLSTAGALKADSDAAVDLGAKERYIAAPSNVMWTGSGGFGACGWVRPPGLPASTETICVNAHPTVTANIVELVYNTSGTLSLKIAGSVVATTTATLAANAWNFVSVVRESDGRFWDITIAKADSSSTTGFIRSLTTYDAGSVVAFTQSVSIAALFGIGTATGVPSIPNFTGAVDDWMVWSSSAPEDNTGSGYDYALNPLITLAFLPGNGDTGVARFNSLLDYAEWPSAWRASSAETNYEAMTLGSYASAPGNVLDGLRTLAATMTAEVWADHNGQMNYKGWAYPDSEPSPRTTLSDISGFAPAYRDRSAVRGTLDRKTRVIVNDGTSTTYIENPDAVPGAKTDDSVSIFPSSYTDHAADVALRRSRSLFDPKTRVDPVILQMAGQSDATRAKVLQLDLVDAIAVVRNGKTTTGKVVKMVDTVTNRDWEVSISTEPHPSSYQQAARSTSVKDQAITSGTDSVPVLLGETWDTDAMHPGATNAAATGFAGQATNRINLRPSDRYLLHAAARFGPNTTGSNLPLRTEIRDSAGNTLARMTQHDSVNLKGPDVFCGRLFVAGSYVQSVVRNQNASFQDLRSSIYRDGPNYPYAPALTAVRAPSSAQAFAGRKTTSTASGTDVAINLDSEWFDTHGLHDTVTNPSRVKLGAQRSYLVGVSVVSSTTNPLTASLRVGGSTVVGRETARAVLSTFNTTASATSLWRPDADTYVEGLFTASSSVLVENYVSQEVWLLELARSCRVTRTANTANFNGPAVSGFGTPGVVTWQSARWDDGAMWNAGTPTRLTADRDGWWALWQCDEWQAGTTGTNDQDRWLWFLVNGRTQVASRRTWAISSSASAPQCLWVPWWLNAGDYVEVFAQNNAVSTNIPILKTADYSPEFGIGLIDNPSVSTPDQITSGTVEGWWEADTLTQPDNTPVASWTDRSGKGRHAVQNTAANRPTFRTNRLNGLPAIVFDGTNDYLTALFGATVTQPTTYFVVASSTSTSAGWRPVDGAPGGGQQAMFGVPSANWDIYAGNVVTGPARDTTTRIFAATFNGASSKLWVSGGAATTGNAGAQSVIGLIFGADQTLSAFHSGDIYAEVAVSGVLSLADINLIGRYLSWKTGLQWTTAT